MPPRRPGWSKTWRGVKNHGAWLWSKVSRQYHGQGGHQPFIDRTNGLIYNPGHFGIERSGDSGLTWTMVSTTPADVVVGTPGMLYAGCSYPVESPYDPRFQHARRSSGTSWSPDPIPKGMANGPKRIAITTDGRHQILLSGNWLAGIWRFVESGPDEPNPPLSHQ